MFCQLLIKVIVVILKNLLAIPLFVLLPWRETELLTCQLKVQNRQKHIIQIFVKKKPTLARKYRLRMQLFPHKPRLFHLLTKTERAYSVGLGHQFAQSR